MKRLSICTAPSVYLHCNVNVYKAFGQAAETFRDVEEAFEGAVKTFDNVTEAFKRTVKTFQDAIEAFWDVSHTSFTSSKAV